jgi:hypothetical protein
METAITTKKFTRVENTDTEFLQAGIVAFQLVQISYSFYGQEMNEIFDTKIMNDGKQIVIDGNGFIKSGFQI